MLKDLIAQNRSRRRFDQSVTISQETLRELVDLARLSASGMNRQPLKYILSNDPARNAKIFPHLAWALNLEDWPGPAEGERPSAYIIILGDTRIHESAGVDHGIAAQSIMLGATEKGLGGCMLASIKRPALRRDLDIPAHLDILLVLALGQPAEEVVIDKLGADGDTRYWRDAGDVHHVPKRSLDELIVN